MPTLRCALLALLLTAPATLAAHDLYLVSGVAGAEDQVCARIGERFPDSTNTLAANRVEHFRLLTRKQTLPLEGKAAEGNQFCAPLPAHEPAIAEMAVHPMFIRLEGKSFTEYITGEGFKHVLREREVAGEAEAPGRELYSRYAKLFLGKLGEAASRPLGHTLEIVPEVDPAEHDISQPLPVRVIYRGRLLADAQVAAVYSGAPMEGHEFPVVTRTDRAGRALLKLDRPGLWYARLIHMVPVEDDPEVHWRSFFATLTFEVKKAK
jgi:hypothetical protein